MKKLLFLSAFCALFIVSTIFGEQTTNQKIFITPNSLNVNGGLGIGYITGMRIAGGVEYGIGNFWVDRKIPFSYGIAGRMGMNLVSLPAFFAGTFGTLHFTWGSLSLPKGLEWIGNFDSYIGLGVLLIPVVDFDSIGGISYYFTKKVALNVEAGLKASYIGLLCIL